jgi:hypothetical protein
MRTSFLTSRTLVSLLMMLGACAKGDALTGGGDTGGNGGSSQGGASSSGAGNAVGGETSTGGQPSGGMGTGGAGNGGNGGSGGAENKCGNGMLNAGEACDGELLGEQDCVSIAQGFTGGTLACAADCSFDTSACTSPPNCGNGSLNAGEECDGNLLGGATCSAAGFNAGTVSCTAGCTLDTSQCYSCGNGTLEAAEVCDGANLNGNTCAILGHDAGTLTCSANCQSFNEAACTDCGDGLVEAGEACDGNNLAGQTCVTQGFNGGSLSCNSECQLNLQACTGQTCGNSAIEGTEICDGSTLAGQTCVTQGFAGGTLACNANCNGYITSSCVGSQCQNGSDDDMDGFVDLSDPGCSNAADNDEELFLQNCAGVGGPIYDVTFANTNLDVVVTGSTVGAPNAYSPTDFFDDCSTATGGELVLMYRVLSTMSAITFSTVNPGTNFDTVLYVRGGNCGPAASEVCNDDGFLTTRSEFTLVNVTPGDYYIIVDGWAGQAGNVELTIDIPNAFGLN